MKTCNLCNTKKPLSEFYKSKDSKDGYRTYCKLCGRNRGRLYYYLKKLNPVVEVKAPAPRVNVLEWIKRLFATCIIHNYKLYSTEVEYDVVKGESIQKQRIYTYKCSCGKTLVK